jgi:membrane AbrB-like protein
MPGHLSLVMSIVVKQNSNSDETTRIALIMGVRVLILTILLPIGAMVGGTLPASMENSGPTIDLWQLIILTIICVTGGAILQILRVPGGLVLGVILVSLAGKLAGYYQGVLPDPLTGLAFITMGALIGSRMSKITWIELRRNALAGLTVAAISVGLATGTAFLVGRYMQMPFGLIWLGLAPGGLEAMAALGLAFGYDSAFIAAHHTWRLLILGIAIPAFAPYFTNTHRSNNPR